MGSFPETYNDPTCPTEGEVGGASPEGNLAASCVNSSYTFRSNLSPRVSPRYGM